MTNATPKVTKRDFFNCLLNLLEDAKAAGVANYNYDEIAEMIHKEIASLDKKAEQAKVRAQKAKEAGDELRAALHGVLTENLQTIAEILAAVQAATGDTSLSAQKITGRLGQLVDLGQAVRGEVSIQAPDGGKSRKLAAYALIS